METRTDLIKYLIEVKGYKTYLEIGIQNGDNWREININKVGVDPNVQKSKGIHIKTSNEFFKKNKDTFDIIFVDGDHARVQSFIDINNSLDVLNKGGLIVCHDSSPKDENHTNVWLNGEVYLTISKLRKRSDLKITTWDGDHGCAIIEKKESTPINFEVNNYKEFNAKRNLILNLKTEEQIRVIFNESKPKRCGSCG